MTIRIFDGNSWNKIANYVNVFRSSTSTWVAAKKISVFRGDDLTGYWYVAYPDPPVKIVGRPGLTGNPAVGTALSLSNVSVFNAEAYRAVDTQTYQWQRSADGLNNPVDIPGETSTSYTLQSTDAGYYVRLRVRGTNSAGSTDAFTGYEGPVIDPTYVFQFNNELGVNPNSVIMLDKVNGVFPDTSNTTLVNSRIIGYFIGGYKTYSIWYKSDTTTFRIYHELYRSSISRPAAAEAEYEVVFTAGSNVVDVYVAKAFLSSYLGGLNYAYWAQLTTSIYKTHVLSSYAANVRFRIILDATVANTTSVSAAPSTTNPSIGTGWIELTSTQDSTSATQTFTSGANSFSPIAQNVNGAFTKSNMFFPSTPGVANPAYLTSTTALVAWTSGSIPGNSFYVTVTRNDTSAQVFAGSTTSSSITLQNLVLGVTHTVSVSPNSRSETSPFLGQFGLAGTIDYLHSDVPGAVQNITASSPTTGLIGGFIPGIFWSVTWSAPAANGGSAVTDYEWATDWDAGGTFYGFGGETSTSNSLSASVGILNGLQAYVRVRARNAKGPGPWSQITLNSSPSQPGTPSAGVISSTNAQTSVNWAASNANGGTSLAYRVYRSQNTNVWNERTTAAQSNTSYSDNIAGSGTTYYYKVIPENKLATNVTFTGVESNASAALTVTQPTVNTPVVSGSNQSTTINVSWSGTAGSGSTPSYQLYRGQNSANLTAFGTGNLRTASAQTTASYADTGSAGDSTYYYRVDLTNNINSVASGVSGGLTLSPGAPGKPAINAQNNTNNNVTMNWTAATDNLSSGAINYKVYRSQNTNVWTEVTTNGTLNNTNRTFVDLYNQPTSPPVTFYYRVDAVNVYAQVASAYSNAISAS